MKTKKNDSNYLLINNGFSADSDNSFSSLLFIFSDSSKYPSNRSISPPLSNTFIESWSCTKQHKAMRNRLCQAESIEVSADDDLMSPKANCNRFMLNLIRCWSLTRLTSKPLSFILRRFTDSLQARQTSSISLLYSGRLELWIDLARGDSSLLLRAKNSDVLFSISSMHLIRPPTRPNSARHAWLS